MDDPLPPAACASMDDCPSGFLCVDNFCRQTCNGSGTCDPGEVCARQETASACVPEQQPEGGPDARDEPWGPEAASRGDEPWGPEAALPGEETATDTGVVVVEDSPEEADASPSEAGPSYDATTEDSPAVDASDAGRPDAPSSTVGADGPPPLDDAGCPTAPSRIVLFSGLEVAKNQVDPDTWQWDEATWTLLDPGATDAGGAPNARYLASMGGICGRAVLFGGNDGASTQFGDQWSWNGISWAPVPVPVDGGAPMPTWAAATGALNDTLVLFGGMQRSSVALADTWVFGGTTWTHVAGQAKPTARSASAIAPTKDGLLLLGGLDVNSFVLSDAWTWNGVYWVTANAPPVPLWGASAAALGSTVVLFGGVDISGMIRGETWIWDGTAWMNAMPAHSPSARYFASIATLGNVVVLFGGTNDTQDFPDTWTWNGTDWTNTNQFGPSARDGAAMTSF